MDVEELLDAIDDYQQQVKNDLVRLAMLVKESVSTNREEVGALSPKKQELSKKEVALYGRESVIARRAGKGNERAIERKNTITGLAV